MESDITIEQMEALKRENTSIECECGNAVFAPRSSFPLRCPFCDAWLAEDSEIYA